MRACVRAYVRVCVYITIHGYVHVSICCTHVHMYVQIFVYPSASSLMPHVPCMYCLYCYSQCMYVCTYVLFLCCYSQRMYVCTVPLLLQSVYVRMYVLFLCCYSQCMYVCMYCSSAAIVSVCTYIRKYILYSTKFSRDKIFADVNF